MPPIENYSQPPRIFYVVLIIIGIISSINGSYSKMRASLLCQQAGKKDRCASILYLVPGDIKIHFYSTLLHEIEVGRFRRKSSFIASCACDTPIPRVLLYTTAVCPH